MNRFWLVLLGTVLAGCSAVPTPAQTATAPPTTRAITVRLVDTVPLDIYFNVDDKVCKAQPFGEPALTHGPQVTIADGAGKVVMSQDGPLIGGKNDNARNACVVDVEFKAVPASDVVVATVTSYDGKTWNRTVQSSTDDPQLIEIQI